MVSGGQVLGEHQTAGEDSACSLTEGNEFGTKVIFKVHRTFKKKKKKPEAIPVLPFQLCLAQEFLSIFF